MLGDLAIRHAAERPDEMAFVSDEGQLSWRDLDAQVGRLAAALVEWPAGPESIVALALSNGLPFVIAFLGLARAGAQTVLLGNDMTESELSDVLTRAGCRTLIAHDRHEATPGLLRSRVIDRAIQATRSDYGSPSLMTLAAASPATHLPEPNATAPFLHLLTAGTTGTPKRVIRSQAALHALATNYCRTVDLSARDRTLATIPLHHGFGLCHGVLATLYAGARATLSRFDRRRTLRVLRDERISSFSASPFVFSILAETDRNQKWRFPALRLPLVGGAVLDQDVWFRVRDRLGLELRQQYGASETGVVSINVDDDPEQALASVGRPIAGVDVAIWDEAGQAVPIGTPGHIAVRSAGAAQWSAAGERACGHLETLADRRGWIRLSDSGRLDASGRLFVAQRTDAVVTAAGRKIDPMEVEAALLSHRHVERVSLMPIRDRHGSEAHRAVVFCSEPCDSGELIAFCAERLSPHKVPRAIEVRLTTSGDPLAVD